MQELKALYEQPITCHYSSLKGTLDLIKVCNLSLQKKEDESEIIEAITEALLYLLDIPNPLLIWESLINKLNSDESKIDLKREISLILNGHRIYSNYIGNTNN